MMPLHIKGMKKEYARAEKKIIFVLLFVF